MSAGEVDSNIVAPGPAIEAPTQERLRRDTFWTRWYRNRSFVAGCSVLGVIACMIVAAPVLAPHSPTQQNLTSILQAPSHQHLLGTDELGIDVWSQLLHGLGVDLRIALLAVIEGIIAGAGGAAHLPGMLAAKTILPVIGVPIPTQHLGGLDSLLSIVQMPRGVPVATVAIGNAENAAILAAEILALGDAELRARVQAYRQEQTRTVLDDESNQGR